MARIGTMPSNRASRDRRKRPVIYLHLLSTEGPPCHSTLHGGHGQGLPAQHPTFTLLGQSIGLSSSGLPSMSMYVPASKVRSPYDRQQTAQVVMQKPHLGFLGKPYGSMAKDFAIRFQAGSDRTTHLQHQCCRRLCFDNCTAPEYNVLVSSARG
jgi:hypothetical protein